MKQYCCLSTIRNFIRSMWRLISICIMFFIGTYGTLHAQSVIGTYPNGGAQPWAMVVNPLTNKVYVSSYYANNVTVIDASANTTATVSFSSGYKPGPIAVNPLTNKVYVGSQGVFSMSAIDGATNSTTNYSEGGTFKL